MRLATATKQAPAADQLELLSSAPGRSLVPRTGRPAAGTSRAGEGAGVSAETSCHAADRVFLDCRGALASPSVVPAARGPSPGVGAGRASRRRGEREPGLDARMPPGSRTGLWDGRAVGRVPADPGDPGPGADASSESSSRPGSGTRRDARERRGGAGQCGPGSPGYRRVRLLGVSRPVVPSR